MSPLSSVVTPAGAAAGRRADQPSYIEINGLSKSFNGIPVLRHLDLRIPEGQFLVLLGPSGCGKTTTMRSLVGLETAEEGSIRVDGSVLFDADAAVDVPPNKRNMGMVFQSYALWPHKSVFQNVAFPLQMQKVGKAGIAVAVRSALHTVGLDGFEKRSVTTLSGGQMQRVALARSLVMNPKILLLDEPLSNLDAKLRVHLRHELKEIQQRIGVTTVYVTHDQDEALGLADRIVVMCDGVIAQDGQPEELFRRPATPFVADFLGMSNQYEAAVVTAEGDRATVSLPGTPITVSCVDGRTRPADDGYVCVRPESVRITRRDGDVGGDFVNHWPATLLSSQYQGTRVRYHASLTGGPDVFADSPAVGPRLHPGDECTIGVASEDVLLLQGPADWEE